MNKFRIWLYGLILKWNKRRLKRKLLLMELSLTNRDEWVLSFELCHMILTTIPPAMLEQTRAEEDLVKVTLRQHQLDKILNHLDEIADHIQVQISNLTRPSIGQLTARPISTRNYPLETNAFSLGRLLVDTRQRMTAKELHHILIEKIARICELNYNGVLPEVAQPYVDRMSYPVLVDCFELSSALTGLALNEETNEQRPY